MATIVTDAGVFEISAVPLKGTLLLREDELPDVTGWELNDQGLCRGDVCVPVRAHPEIREEGMVNLRVFAALVNQPLAIDEETETAALGASCRRPRTRRRRRPTVRVEPDRAQEEGPRHVGVVVRMSLRPARVAG